MRKRVSIIGAGNVGATTAQFVLQSGIADTVLFDIVDGMPQGKALDLAEACPLWGSSALIKGTNDFSDTADSDIVVIAAGSPRKPGMSRDDLLYTNSNVIRKICVDIAKTSPRCTVIVVTNPMDVMTYLAWKTTAFPRKRVIGMGGILDATRLITFLSHKLNVSPEDVETLVLGGHRDDMVILTRFTSVKGIPVTELLPKEAIDSLIERTRRAGAEIVSLLKTGGAYYAPAAAVFQMIKSIILDEKRLFPCATYLNGEYGIKDICIGVPVILGKEGVEKIIEVKLTEEERTQFMKSCSSVRELIEKLSI